MSSALDSTSPESDWELLEPPRDEAMVFANEADGFQFVQPSKVVRYALARSEPTSGPDQRQYADITPPLSQRPRERYIIGASSNTVEHTSVPLLATPCPARMRKRRPRYAAPKDVCSQRRPAETAAQTEERSAAERKGRMKEMLKAESAQLKEMLEAMTGPLEEDASLEDASHAGKMSEKRTRVGYQPNEPMRVNSGWEKCKKELQLPHDTKKMPGYWEEVWCS